MPEILSQTLAFPGLLWLALTVSVAGIVRGFTGFGTALIFVPIANLFISPAEVILLITLTGIGSATALVPQALKVADLKEVSTLGLAALITVPLGVWLLQQMDHVSIRWVASALALCMLTALVLGWRYSGRIDLTRLLLIGAVAGVFGGLTGLTGPVVILFYLASGARSEIVRANTIIFLAMLDFVIAGNLFLQGLLTWEIFFVAVVLCVPYFITTKIGQAFFAPGYEKTYRAVAYAVIGMAVVTGLPIWD